MYELIIKTGQNVTKDLMDYFILSTTEYIYYMDGSYYIIDTATKTYRQISY